MEPLYILVLLLQFVIPIALIIFIVRVLIIQKRLKNEVEKLNMQLKEIIDKKSEEQKQNIRLVGGQNGYKNKNGQ